MSETFNYEGLVTLRSQEGGFVGAAIELNELPGTRWESPALAEVLDEAFAQDLRHSQFGDVALGRMRISIERVARP